MRAVPRNSNRQRTRDIINPMHTSFADLSYGLSPSETVLRHVERWERLNNVSVSESGSQRQVDIERFLSQSMSTSYYSFYVDTESSDADLIAFFEQHLNRLPEDFKNSIRGSLRSSRPQQIINLMRDSRNIYKFLLYNWENDILFSGPDQSAQRERIHAAQLRAIRQALRSNFTIDGNLQRIVRTFLIESGIYQSVLSRLGIAPVAH